MTASLNFPGRKRLLRSAAFGTAACMVVTVGAMAWPGSAGAAATDTYDLSASAVAVQTTFNDPNVPFNLPVSVGSYGANSALDSNGVSVAEAGAPFSPFVSGLAPLGSGVVSSTFGFPLPVVPTLPGFVRASDPLTPSARQSAGGYELIANALPGDARGSVSIGGQGSVAAQNNAFADARSVATPEGVISEGTAGIHALTLAGIIDIANVSSYARLSKDANGKVTPISTTSLGTISFGGVTSGVTDSGAAALGTAPTPISTDGLAAINDALKPAGITVTYLPEVYTYTDGKTSTGPKVNPKKEVARFVSGALEIFFANTSDRGTTSEKVTVGQVTLTAEASGADGAPLASNADGAAGASLSGDQGVDAAVADPAVIPGGIPGAIPGAIPGTIPPTVASGAPLPTGTFLPASSAAGTLAGGSTAPFDDVYLLLVAAAAIALLGGQAIRLVAVRRG